MTEIKLYKYDFCNRAYDTQARAKSCEDSHEKNLEISSAVYVASNCKGMPSEIRLQNKERTKLATYRFVGVIERWSK